GARARLAAVRSATEGTEAGAAAAAPYAGGRWLFSHNGRLNGWPGATGSLAATLPAADLLALEARCDSALAWALVSSRLRAGAGPAGAPAPVRRAPARHRGTGPVRARGQRPLQLPAQQRGGDRRHRGGRHPLLPGERRRRAGCLGAGGRRTRLDAGERPVRADRDPRRGGGPATARARPAGPAA